MKSLTAFLRCSDQPEQTGEFQCKAGKGAWMHRIVLDLLLKMLTSTFICWKLKLPVMLLLEAEVSAQTGSRGVRMRCLCASRGFPEPLAAAVLGILELFPPVRGELAQHSGLGGVRAAQQHIPADLTQQAAEIASCPYGGGITFLNSLFWLVRVSSGVRWDLLSDSC